ncbi:MAG TPA: nitroreductase family deazaflavin-dependent oxidoreductase [Solirubrobacterales bacterium]
MDYLDVADRAWPVIWRAMGAHTFLYRRTGGRLGQRLPGIRGRVLLLDHVGARSGVKRTSPLLYAQDGKDLLLVASKGGFPKNPAWYYNLRANPDTTVQVGSELRDVHARVAGPEERERLWALAVASYRGYEDYRARTDREIPLVVLEPRKTV